MAQYTQADLDKIDAALKSGNLLLSFGDRKIRRYDFKELVQLRQMVLNTIKLQNGQSVPCMKVCQLTTESNL